METIERRHGSTSIGLPGIRGEQGQRSRIFYYGNINGNTAAFDSSFAFSSEDSPEDEKYAILPDGNEPEEYDYIFYTDNDYDIIYVITSVTKVNDEYYCVAREIDRMSLTESKKENDNLNTTFMVNTIPVKQEYTSRDSINVEIAPFFDPYRGYYPLTKTRIFNNIFSFSISVPSTSSYVFTSDTKITLEFNSIQSSIMDSMINSKFSYPSQCGYKGHIEKYSIYSKKSTAVEPGIKGSEQEQAGGYTIIENDVNFDDERLENFIITIKDFNQGNGSKSIEKSTMLMTDSLKRYGADPRAYLCFYTKYGGGFIRKSIIGELPLDFIETHANSGNTINIENSAQIAQLNESINNHNLDS